MQGAFATIMFAELSGAAAVGDAVARREQLVVMRAVLSEHDGHEVRPTDSGVMAVFASAAAAVACAEELQRRTAAAAGAPVLAVGLDAGEPEDDADELSATAVVVASRLCQHAGPGEVLATDLVCKVALSRAPERVEPMGTLKLRDVPRRVAAGRVLPVGSRTAPVPSADRPITVVVVDDERLLRSGFRVILEAEPDMTVVGEAADGRAAIDVVARRRPDVVLMDIRMPELDGLQAAERILADPESQTAVLMLTTFDLDQHVYDALRIGASGFLLKDTPADRLLDAVRVAAAGEALLAPSITRRLIEQFTEAARPEAGAIPPELDGLSARELDVLRLLARGLSNAEIADALVLGENTIRTHVGAVLRKLGLRDRVQAVVLAYESRLVGPEGA